MVGSTIPPYPRLLAFLGRAAGRRLWATESSDAPRPTFIARALSSTSSASTSTSSSSPPSAAKAWREATTPSAVRFMRRAAAWFPATEQTAPERIGGWLYWSEDAAGAGGPILLRAPAADSSAREVVLDAAAAVHDLGAVGGVAAVKVSPCGRLVAVVADADGHPCASVRAIGRRGEVSRLPGALGVEWGAFGTGDLFYTVDRGGDGRPCEVRAAPGVGETGGRGAPHPLLLHLPDARSHLALGRTKDGHWLTATAVRRDAAAPHVLRLTGGGGEAAFQAVGTGTAATSGACVETFVEGDGRGGLLLLTNDRSGGRCEGVSEHEAWLAWAAGPGAPPTAWVPLLARRPGVVISDVDAFCCGASSAAAADSILLYERDTAVGAPRLSLTRLRWGGEGGAPPTASPPERVRLPGDQQGAAGPGAAPWASLTPGANACPASPSARIFSSSPLASAKPWDVDLATGHVSPVASPPAAQAAAAAVARDAAGLALRRLTIPSNDDGGGGAAIPLTVVEGATPPVASLLVLYGAYGTPLDAAFEPLWLTLAAEGWRIVLAGVRGGGDLGRAWHAAGRGAARPAAAADAAAAAAWAAVGPGVGGTPLLPVVVSAESAGGLLAGHLLQRGGVAGAILRSPFLDICKHAGGGVVPPAADAVADPIQRALAEHEVGEWSAPGDAPALADVCPTTRLRSPPYPPSFPPVRITCGAQDERVPVADVQGWVAAWGAAAVAAGGEGLTESNPAIVEVWENCGHEGPRGRDALAAMAADAAFAARVVEKARS